MTVTATHLHPDGNYDIEPFILSDTNETTVLSGLDGFRLHLTEIWLADDAGAARTATIKITRAGTEITLVSGAAIPANEPLVYPFNGPVLKKTSANTDTVKVTGSAAGIHGYVGFISVASTT